MAGGSGGEEEHGVFLADGVAIVDLREELRGVGELAFELVANFFSDGEAARADGGADGGDEVLGAGAEVAAKGADAALDDAGEGAAPAGVEGGDGAGAGVGDEDGDAVGSEDGEEKVWVAGIEAVAAEDGFEVRGGEREVGGVDSLDDAGVALADGDEIGRGLAGLGDGGDEAVAGGEDGGRVVFGGIAEVLFGRTAGGVGGREAPLPRAEAGDEPRVLAPGRDSDDAGSTARSVRWGGFCGGLGGVGGTATAAGKAGGSECCV